MNDGQNTRAQIVERIKASANILVTVSTNPTVDELSAALGLTIMLNGLNKHTTAVVSGDIPPAIEFLEPGKTFENTVDSLRDFIIALDKEKADHLRYKVDGDVVKIFITPYRTTLTSDDLDFSQGDYNVELVLALGVKNKDHLDAALAAHGRILHDATVATLSCGEEASELGSIDWYEPNASSLSEMLVALSEALKGDKPILDEQSATAFLTGIVAATDRFSNTKTSSKVMTMAAQLMAAGANQQLIAAKLEEAHEIGQDKPDDDSDSGANSDGTTDLSEGESTKLKKSTSQDSQAKKDDGELAISHVKEGDVDDVAAQTAQENQASAAKTAEDELAEQLADVAPAAANKPSVEDLHKDLASASAEIDEAAASTAAPDAVLPPVVAGTDEPVEEPIMGGTLNATAEQAQHEKEVELEGDRNKKILSHNSGSYVGDSAPAFQAPFNAASSTPSEPPSVDIFNDDKPAVNLTPPGAAPGSQAVTPLPPTDDAASDDAVEPEKPAETLEDIDKKNRSSDHDEARSAVELAYEATPFNPAHQPQASIGAQPLGEVPHDNPAPLPPLPAPPAPEPPVAAPNAPVDFSVLPPPPPLPTFDQPTTPPVMPPQGALPPEQLGQIFGTPPAAPSAPAAPAPNDPNQFKIPGQ
ncbi:MAG TPA: hypothetical protein PK096_01920 [Candidatus Saccharibacteria bacterium]|nr:hypothetical protein [Candidatus Saccharibacteria bacterium]HRK94104.1 hypothetical protein [Candidatus Saccharibacteria bacterium]